MTATVGRKGTATAAPARRRPLLSRFLVERDGVTAVEFGIVALPFFALLLGIIEIALIFFAGQILESGVSNSARLIRTGQAQTQSLSASELTGRICEQTVFLSNCAAKLKLDVRTYPDFESLSNNLTPPIDADGNLIENFGYQPGVGGDIVMVRAYYEWPTIMPTFGLGPGNLSNGNRLLMSTAAFRNEPF